MILAGDILNFVESLAPRYMKMEWDNVGLLCGSHRKAVKKVLVALDPFEGVVKEAEAWGADVIVTHHPLIFRAPLRITEEDEVGRCILRLAGSGIAAINAHTNLDCAPGGVNDCLASRLGLENVEVVKPQGADGQGRPWGLLRAGTVDKMNLPFFLERVRERLGCPGLRFVDGGRPVQKVAVGGGGCADGLLDALDAGCDTFVTSDIKYNQFWNAKANGLNLIDAGHFWTENPVTVYLARALQDIFPELEVKISETHTDCIKFC